MEINKDGTFSVAPAAQKMGLKFANAETGQEFLIQVNDKFPQMGDVHIEGRRYVEVSTEMFVTLLAAVGFYPVLPENANEENVNEEEV